MRQNLCPMTNGRITLNSLSVANGSITVVVTMQRFPHHPRLLLGLGICLLAACASQPPTQEPAAAPAPVTAAAAESSARVSFERQVKPILESKCLACHSGASAPWGFRLESKEFAFVRGTSGPRIVPGKPEQTLILALASTHKNVAVMPLDGAHLTEAESKTLRRWVEEGATWPAGRSGHLTPSHGSIRPEYTAMREEWKKWSKEDKTQE